MTDVDVIDANIFLRHLTRDDEEKAARSRRLFERAQRGEVELMTSEAIVLEVVQVLESPRLYRMPRPILATVMKSLLENRGLRLDHKATVVHAFDVYQATTVDFADCLIIAHARRLGGSSIYSFDRGLDRVVGVRRVEP
jgi:predicted nucleic-acid-binding protein